MSTNHFMMWSIKAHWHPLTLRDTYSTHYNLNQGRQHIGFYTDENKAVRLKWPELKTVFTIFFLCLLLLLSLNEILSNHLYTKENILLLLRYQDFLFLISELLQTIIAEYIEHPHCLRLPDGTSSTGKRCVNISDSSSHLVGKTCLNMQYP